MNDNDDMQRVSGAELLPACEYIAAVVWSRCRRRLIYMSRLSISLETGSASSVIHEHKTPDSCLEM